MYFNDLSTLYGPSMYPTVSDDDQFAEPFQPALMTSELNLSLRLSQVVYAPESPLRKSSSLPLPSPLSTSQLTERPLKRSRDEDPAVEDPAVEDPAMQEPSRKKARKSRDTTERPDGQFGTSSSNPSEAESVQTTHEELTPDQYEFLTRQQLKALPAKLRKKVQSALSARKLRQKKTTDQFQIALALFQYGRTYPNTSLQSKLIAWEQQGKSVDKVLKQLPEIFTSIVSDVSGLLRENIELRDRIKKLEAAFQQ